MWVRFPPGALLENAAHVGLIGELSFGFSFLLAADHWSPVFAQNEPAAVPDISLQVEGAFSFAGEDGLSGRLLEGDFVLSSMGMPNAMLTLGKPSRSMYGENLEITLAHDSPPLESGTYSIIDLHTFRNSDETDEKVVASIKYQEEGAHPRDRINFEEAIQGTLVVERDGESVSGEFALTAENTGHESVKVRGTFQQIEILSLD